MCSTSLCVVGLYSLPDHIRWDPTLDTSRPTGRTANDTFSTVARLLPLDSSPQEVDAYVKQSVIVSNLHDTHNRTCAKGGRRGDDTDCRMNFPLPLIRSTMRLIGSLFAVRRTSGAIVPYNFGLMLAYPANHLFRFACEASVWCRQLLLWKQAGNDTVSRSTRLC